MAATVSRVTVHNITRLGLPYLHSPVTCYFVRDSFHLQSHCTYYSHLSVTQAVLPASPGSPAWPGSPGLPPSPGCPAKPGSPWDPGLPTLPGSPSGPAGPVNPITQHRTTEVFSQSTEAAWTVTKTQHSIITISHHYQKTDCAIPQDLLWKQCLTL